MIKICASFKPLPLLSFAFFFLRFLFYLILSLSFNGFFCHCVRRSVFVVFQYGVSWSVLPRQLRLLLLAAAPKTTTTTATATTTTVSCLLLRFRNLVCQTLWTCSVASNKLRSVLRVLRTPHIISIIFYLFIFFFYLIFFSTQWLRLFPETL